MLLNNHTTMKSQLPLHLLLLLHTTTTQALLPWDAPSETDLRAPCPLLNSLANHYFLPHDGANISVEVLVNISLPFPPSFPIVDTQHTSTY